jgi:hypothetical protein
MRGRQTLVSRFGEFNTTSRCALALALVLGIGLASGAADEIRKWRDADGNMHYSITGSPDGKPGGAPLTVLKGREPTPEEIFSVQASLSRTDLEKKLTAAGRALEETRAEIAKTERRQFDAWIPAVTDDPRAAQASLDRQRDALLAASQAEQQKAGDLRRLRRRERGELKEILALWKEFDALDAKVTERYGKAPDWWRKRLDCRGCPSAAEVAEALHPPPPTPLPGAEKGAEKPGSADTDEDDEGWESAWD